MVRRTLALGLCLWLVALPAAAQPETPLQLYGELFVDVQLQRVFEDGKTFADAVPNDTPATILRRYREERLGDRFDLAAFVARNFSLPRQQASTYRAVPGQDVCDHIDGLWAGARAPAGARSCPTARCCRCPFPTSCRAGASPRSTTGTPISPCWAWSRAGGATWPATWCATSPAWSIATATCPTATAPTISAARSRRSSPRWSTWSRAGPPTRMRFWPNTCPP